MDPAEADRIKQAITSQGARVGQHDKALQEIRTTLQNLSSGVNQLGSRLNEVASQLSTWKPPDQQQSPDSAQASGPPPSAAQQAQPREPFIPTPGRYSGELGLCKQFIHQCMLVFDQQPLTYGSDRSRVAFVMSLLSGKASVWAVALANSDSPVCNTLDSFTAEMLRVFDHPLQGKEASNRLLSLRQGSGSVSAYSIDFRILATECGWDDKALQGIFFRGLSENVKDELAARDETSTLEELISLSIRLDNRLRERRRERAVRPSFPITNTCSRLPNQHEPPPAFPHQDSSSVPAPTTASSPEEPMQLGRLRLTQEERQRRLSRGLCVYCGQAGHILLNCPTRPKDQAHQRLGGRW